MDESGNINPAVSATGVSTAFGSWPLLGWCTAGNPALKLDIAESLPCQWQNSSHQGSFILAAVLGNTGFVGLAIAPSLISDDYLNWAVFYSITHNLVDPYGLGVLIASYFGRAARKNHWWTQLAA